MKARIHSFDSLRKAPFIGPKGGLYADPQHKTPWDPDKKVDPKKCPRCKGVSHVISRQTTIGGKDVVSSAPCRTCNKGGKLPLNEKRAKALGLPVPPKQDRASTAPPEREQPAQKHQMKLDFSKPEQMPMFKGYSLEGGVNFQGLDVAIENGKGSKRQWGPKPEQHTVMVHPYGYLRGVKGADGDELDVYIGPHNDSDVVFVVNQRRVRDKRKFDEHKVMLGFKTVSQAREAYLAHYKPRELGKKLLGSIRMWSMDRFKKWLEESSAAARKKPVRKSLVVPR